MPGTRCTVAVCNNSFAKTKRAGMNIMYHQFPKCEPVRNIWIEKCRRAGNWNPNSCHICSIHFTVNDYIQDTSSNLLNVRSKRRLKSTAVPSLFLTEPPPLELISLTQKKSKKISLDDNDYIHSCEYMDHEEIVCNQLDINSQCKSTNDLSVYESSTKENSNNEDVKYIVPYENNDLEVYSQDSEYCYTIDNEIEIKEENREDFEPLKISEYIIVQDSSTQTVSDYFLENYELLLNKNRWLESELQKSNHKCKKLRTSVNVLKSEIKRLEVSLNQT